MRAASYRSDGPFAGRVVHHRNIDGPQLWTIIVTIERAKTIDQHTIMPKDRVYLSEIQALVQRTIDELCPVGSTVDRARLDLFVRKAA